MAKTESTLDEKGLIELSKTEVVVARLNKYMELKVSGLDDKAGLAAVKAARKDARSCRLEVESNRKELKSVALDYGRRVDAAAKKFTAEIKVIETHLEEEESIVKKERERLQKIADEARAEKLTSRLDAMAMVGHSANPLTVEDMSDEAYDELLASLTTAFEAKQSMEAAERQRIADEKAEFEKQKAELEAQQAEAKKREDAIRAEQERQDAERKRMDNEAQKLKNDQELAKRELELKAEAEERAELRAAELVRIAEEKRVANEKLAAERKIAAEAERAEAERLEAERAAQAEAAENERLAEIERARPDAQKLKSYAESLIEVELPELSTKKAKDLAKKFAKELAELTKQLSEFGS